MITSGSAPASLQYRADRGCGGSRPVALAVLEARVVEQPGLARRPVAIGLVQPVAVRPEARIGATDDEARHHSLVIGLAAQTLHRARELRQVGELDIVERIRVGAGETVHHQQPVFRRHAALLLAEG